MNILLTGSSGFVGQKIIPFLKTSGNHVIAVTRHKDNSFENCKTIELDLSSVEDFGDVFNNIDLVIHLAGRAHVLNETSQDPYQAYAEINIKATQNLALLASKNGVKRFIFLSSVKVNGEETTLLSFNETNAPNPQDDYGKTKLEAEHVLLEIAKKTQMEVVIIRPPLIYGKGVKANFKNLIKLCQSKIPLPFGAIHNKRSMVYVENLIDFIALCIKHPKAANETFLISDDEDVSTSTLIRTIRTTLGLPSLLLPIPQSWIVFMLYLIGRKSLSTRLCGNLQVDITKAKTLLGWKPPFTFEQGIKNTIQEK